MNRIFYFHWILPAVLLIALCIALQPLELDLWITDHIYALQNHHWTLKKSWLLETVIHQRGRTLIGIMALCLLASWLTSAYIAILRPYRRGLGYFLLSLVCSLLIVSCLKNLTHIGCPWDFYRYGGDQPYQATLSAIFGTSSKRCFPAGHASGGYAWVASYFFCRQYLPWWRIPALVISLALGLCFGIAQQIRGAHFLSHDLWTLAICWYTPLIIFYYVAKTEKDYSIQTQ